VLFSGIINAAQPTPSDPDHRKAWTVETLGAVVDAEIAALPKDMQAAFLRLAERIEAVGLERIGQPHIKHPQGKLWEMRLSGRDRIARAIYVTRIGRRVVVVHAFVKKTQTTPRTALKIAATRAMEIDP
jgi:phage-related protein